MPGPCSVQKASVSLRAKARLGNPSKAGSVTFDAAAQAYLVAGGGANMWGTNDAFHFVWKRVSGNFSLAADIVGLGAGTG